MFVTREHSIEACNVHKNTRTGQGGATGIEPGAGIGAGMGAGMGAGIGAGMGAGMGAGIGVGQLAAVRVHVPIICSHHRRRKMIKPGRRVVRPMLRPPRKWRRHWRMFDRAQGFVRRRRKLLRMDLRHRVQSVRARPRVILMRSGDLCRYLGCSLRHLYWLIQNRRLPYYVSFSSKGPRYRFRRMEVYAWLQRYRGKGRRLGLRRFQQVGS